MPFKSLKIESNGKIPSPGYTRCSSLKSLNAGDAGASLN